MGDNTSNGTPDTKSPEAFAMIAILAKSAMNYHRSHEPMF